MTRTSTAKIEIRRWKAHTCVACGCRYAYLLVRKLAYGGATREQATEKAQAAAQQALTREVDRQPCPGCGLYQPDMIARGRRAWHAWLLPAALLGMGLITALFLGNVLQADRALAVAMGQVVFFTVLGFLVDFRNPNRDLAANRRTAQQEIAAQRLRALRPAMRPAPGFKPAGMRRYGVVAFGLALLALLALAAPKLMRRQAGWPLNANWYPPVAGPGDETCLYLPDSISSIKGFWTAKSNVVAQLVGEPVAGEFPIDSTTRQIDWSRSIQGKPDDRAVSERLWVRLKLPYDNQYSGRKLLCKIALNVRYPVTHNGEVAEILENHYRHETLELAAPLAARTYRAWWWGGFVGGAVLLAASILARLAGAAALRRRAKPAEVLDVEPA